VQPLVEDLRAQQRQLDGARGILRQRDLLSRMRTSVAQSPSPL